MDFSSGAAALDQGCSWRPSLWAIPPSGHKLYCTPCSFMAACGDLLYLVPKCWRATACSSIDLSQAAGNFCCTLGALSVLLIHWPWCLRAISLPFSHSSLPAAVLQQLFHFFIILSQMHNQCCSRLSSGQWWVLLGSDLIWGSAGLCSQRPPSSALLPKILPCKPNTTFLISSTNKFTKDAFGTYIHVIDTNFEQNSFLIIVPVNTTICQLDITPFNTKKNEFYQIGKWF